MTTTLGQDFGIVEIAEDCQSATIVEIRELTEMELDVTHGGFSLKGFLKTCFSAEYAVGTWLGGQAYDATH